MEHHIRQSHADMLGQAVHTPSDVSASTSSQMDHQHLCPTYGDKVELFSKRKFSCCGKVFGSREPYRYHRTKYHQRVRCDLCDRDFIGHPTFADHCRTVHPGLPMCQARARFTCEYCGTVCWGLKSNLDDHIATEHHGVVHRCTICSKRMNCYQTLYRHMRQEHNPNLRWICEVCGREFKRSAGLQNHMRSTHGDLVPPEKQIICKLCKKSFSRQSGLQLHMSTVHLPEGQYNRCPSCNYRCTLPQYLIRHMAKCHPGDVESDRVPAAEDVQ